MSRIGGNARSVKAKSEGMKPVPSRGMTSASTASDGNVRPMFAAVMATSAARRAPESHTPIGSAMAIARPRAEAESATCVASD